MKEVEALLNKLIELGWNPRGINCEWIKNNGLGKRCYIGGRQDEEQKSINDLCSIDSGLRQFVCEKGIIIKQYNNQIIHQFWDNDRNIDVNKTKFLNGDYHFEYRLMLSSIQENKEQFLLDNIKI